VNAHGDAVAALALLADFDEAGQRHGRDRELQNRMDDVRGAQRRGGKAGGDAGKAERERKANRTAARQDRDCNADERQRRGRPPGRLTNRREINDDAEAESYRHPRDQPSRLDFGGHPFRQKPPQPSGAVGKPRRQQEAGARRRRPKLWLVCAPFRSGPWAWRP
jgi:hypothetical protein